MHIYHVELCVLVLLEIVTHLLRDGWRTPGQRLWDSSQDHGVASGPGLKGMWGPQLVGSFKNVFS